MKKLRILATTVLTASLLTAGIISRVNGAICPDTITGNWIGALGTPESPGTAIELAITKPSWTNDLTATAPNGYQLVATVQCNTWAGTTPEGDPYTGTIDDTQQQITGTFRNTESYFLNRQADPPVQVTVNNAEVTEPDPGGAVNMNFIIQLTDTITSNVTVSYELVNITTNNLDVRDNSFESTKTITFQPGQSLQRVVSVRVWGDAESEADETVELRILSTNAPGGVLNGVGEGVIINNDTVL